jgi:predicted RND superfamily exporter protein
MVTDKKGGIEKIWLTVALMLVLVIAIVFAISADLKPKISPDFFFGSDDPEMADTRKIADLFPAEEFIILNVAGDNIHSAAYTRSLETLSRRLMDLGAFNRLLSLTQGPDSPAAALESPFWRPLLIEETERATFILAFLPRASDAAVITATEEITGAMQGRAGLGRISISGMPYIAEHIKRSIIRDAKIFSLAGLAVFAVLIYAIFKSALITAGATISGLGAIVSSLLILDVLGQPIGILTANLAIIIFVLVQSQIIYLTNNWRRSDGRGISPVITAIRKTLMPAIWCAATTFLGFTSLLFVSAEPLRQLGIGGMIGTISALVYVFALYPAFLTFETRNQKAETPPVIEKPSKIMIKIRHVLALLLVLIALLVTPGLLSLNTDPGLLRYFDPNSDIAKGLTVIDRNGGSSPLQLVVRLKTSDDLDTADAYERLWTLHNAYEKHPAVGTVLSLPALLAEANNHPLAFLLPWREIVTLLRLESNQQVVDNFLGPDRENTLFVLRMKEDQTGASRNDVLQDLLQITENAGFTQELSGGVYALQARLSALVGESVIMGVLALLVIFAGISMAVTRNLSLSIAMTVSAALIPLLVMGANGLLDVPMDIISAPAISISLGLAVDALIHLGMAVRRKLQHRDIIESWRQALREQASGIIAGGGIIALGFSIFIFSEFPPTLRFGVIVIAGAFLAMLSSLTLFPALASFAHKRFGK